MSDKKMLQAIINGQSALKEELLSSIDSLDKKFSDEIKSLRSDMEKGFKRVNKRLDSIGKSVAYLEDDTPTIKEFDELEGRVTKVENKLQI